MYVGILRDFAEKPSVGGGPRGSQLNLWKDAADFGEYRYSIHFEVLRNIVNGNPRGKLGIFGDFDENLKLAKGPGRLSLFRWRDESDIWRFRDSGQCEVFFGIPSVLTPTCISGFQR